MLEASKNAWEKVSSLSVCVCSLSIYKKNSHRSRKKDAAHNQSQNCQWMLLFAEKSKLKQTLGCFEADWISFKVWDVIWPDVSSFGKWDSQPTNLGSVRCP